MNDRAVGLRYNSCHESYCLRSGTIQSACREAGKNGHQPELIKIGPAEKPLRLSHYWDTHVAIRALIDALGMV